VRRRTRNKNKKPWRREREIQRKEVRDFLPPLRIAVPSNPFF
jgi:hypothetical protein